MVSLAPVLAYRPNLREFSVSHAQLFEINTNKDQAHKLPKYFEDALYDLLLPVVQLVDC